MKFGLEMTFDPRPSDTSGALIRQETLYEQISGGCVREVRSNVTLPAGESNLAVAGPLNMSLPSWNGLPQPAGGLPLPSDKGW